MKRKTKAKSIPGSGVVVMPTGDAHCGHCGSGSFSYRNGFEFSTDGVRGYRCNDCGNIKPENWRDIKGVPAGTVLPSRA